MPHESDKWFRNLTGPTPTKKRTKRPRARSISAFDRARARQAARSAGADAARRFGAGTGLSDADREAARLGVQVPVIKSPRRNTRRRRRVPGSNQSSSS
jgi:hypothetical protein